MQVPAEQAPQGLEYALEAPFHGQPSFGAYRHRATRGLKDTCIIAPACAARKRMWRESDAGPIWRKRAPVV
ncbi:MAG: hypothetical protein Kow00123_11510 [Anaerolineales bacterium]